MKTLWIVSGGVEAVPGIQRASDMGLRVVVSDGAPDAPGFAYANDTILASTYDADATVRAAQEYHETKHRIDGVLCVAADVPLTVAHVAYALGLPGIPIDVAQRAMDKIVMKEHLKQADVPLPWFQEIHAVEELKTLLQNREQPLILKPVDSRGARGVLLLDEATDVDWAFRHAQKVSPASRVMVEEFLDGPQVSTESVLHRGEAVTLGFSDRNYEHLSRYAPYIIEDGGTQPSLLPQEDQNRLAAVAEKAGRTLGVVSGTVKGDMVLTKEGPRVIEIAPRLSGGWFCTDQVPLSTGKDLVGASIRMALGEDLDLQEFIPAKRKPVAIRYFFPEPGRVTSIEGVEDCRAEEGIHKIGVFVDIGEVIEPVTDHTKRAGFVITTGRTRDQAVERAEDVVRRVRIETARP